MTSLPCRPADAGMPRPARPLTRSGGRASSCWFRPLRQWIRPRPPLSRGDPDRLAQARLSDLDPRYSAAHLVIVADASGPWDRWQKETGRCLPTSMNAPSRTEALGAISHLAPLIANNLGVTGAGLLVLARCRYGHAASAQSTCTHSPRQITESSSFANELNA